ncbi:MAG: hypothetical protein LUE20_08060 [Oscillospiraceae bacterium]|nr:hypothetical protein [Oscillospiraceae bacterium]
MAEKKTTEKTAQKTKFFKSGNFYLMLFSIVLAFVIWIIMSLTVFPETTITLKDVPIDFSLDGSYADVAGISVMKTSVDTVNVVISGERYLIGDYTADDIHVTVNVDAVRATGSYELSLVVTSVSGDTIEVEQIEPSTVKVDFDYMVSKTYSVEDGTLVADVSNLTAADGYIIDEDEITISPSTIELYGPQDYIDQITSVAVKIDNSAIIQSTMTSNLNSVILYRGNDEFTSEDVTIDNESFEVTVPVYLLRTIPLDITLTSNVDSFDLSSIAYSINPSSITVRSQNENVNSITNINLDYISVNKITVGSVFSVSIAENANYENISGIDTATVTFDLEGYAEKVVTVSNSQIYILNSTDDKLVTVEQAQIQNVILVGPEDVLEQISSSDVVAEIDMLDYANTTSSYTIMDLTIYVPGYDNVWSYGTYRVYVSIENVETEDETDAETESEE